MFERAAIFSALLSLTIFGIASIKFLEFTELETESPLVVLKEMFPTIEEN